MAYSCTSYCSRMPTRWIFATRDRPKDRRTKERIIRRILNQESSRRGRKGKVYKPHLMSTRDIRHCISHISKDWSTRRLSFAQVKAQLGVQASVRTIRRELRRAGYRRCIACPRPYISRNQAKKRLAFALEHR